MVYQTVYYAQFYGINLKADKVIGKKGKTLIGLSSDIGAIYDKANSGSAFSDYGPVKGSLGNLFFNFTRYLLGNASKERNALYVSTGLGGVLFNANKTETFTDGNGNLKQIKDSYNGSNIVHNLGIGGERKLGKGKIYAEVLFAWNVAEKNTITTNDGFALNEYKLNSSVLDDVRSSWADRGWIETPMLRIGYKFHL